MSPAARSILVYSVYLLGQGVVLLAVPNVALRLFGLPETTEIWVRIIGMTVLFFSIYYAVAARYEFRPFFRVSVATRLSVPLIFGALIVAGLRLVEHPAVHADRHRVRGLDVVALRAPRRVAALSGVGAAARTGRAPADRRTRRAGAIDPPASSRTRTRRPGGRARRTCR